MSKRAELKDAMVAAMKAKDELTLSTVRLINAKIKDKDIESRTEASRDGIGDDQILAVLQGMVKQRQESADIYTKNGRPELAARETAEIAVIQTFLPAQMDEAQVKAAIDLAVTETGAAGIKDMGKVMGVLKGKYAGQMDMAKAGGLVKDRLNA